MSILKGLSPTIPAQGTLLCSLCHKEHKPQELATGIAHVPELIAILKTFSKPAAIPAAIEEGFRKNRANSHRGVREYLLVDKQKVADTSTRRSLLMPLLSATNWGIYVINNHNQTVRLSFLAGPDPGPARAGIVGISADFLSETIEPWVQLPWGPWVGISYAYLTAPTDSGPEDYLTIIGWVQEEI